MSADALDESTRGVYGGTEDKNVPMDGVGS
jgi:hypothetical protein